MIFKYTFWIVCFVGLKWLILNSLFLNFFSLLGVLLLHKYNCSCQTICPDFCLKNTVIPSTGLQGLGQGWAGCTRVLVSGLLVGKGLRWPTAAQCVILDQEHIYDIRKGECLSHPITAPHPLFFHSLSRILSCPRKFFALWSEVLGTTLSQEGWGIDSRWLRILNKVFFP